MPVRFTWVQARFLVGFMLLNFKLYVLCFVDHWLSFSLFSFGHCVVCTSSIYGFWLPVWYLHTPITVQYTNINHIIIFYGFKVKWTFNALIEKNQQWNYSFLQHHKDLLKQGIQRIYLNKSTLQWFIDNITFQKFAYSTTWSSSRDLFKQQDVLRIYLLNNMIFQIFTWTTRRSENLLIK